jgi:hypothetical protein
MTMHGDVPCPVNPLAMHKIYVEGNMESIFEMIPIYISKTHGIMENVFVGTYCSLEDIQIYTKLFKQFCEVFSWSYEEIPGIDPSVVEHKITTYPNVKPIRQKLHLVNPHKSTTIKDEVEKFLKVGFIYPLQLMEQISNHVLVNKKQGMIRVCMDFRDLHKACSKDNFPTPFIDQIVDECVGCEVFYWKVFSGKIKFRSRPSTNIKWILFILGVHLRIEKFLLA